MTVAVLLAVAGAFCLAFGSAMQERDAVHAPGRSVARFSLLLHLVRQPRWIAGTVAAAVGVTLHLVALSGGPLTVIQPIGVTALLFALVLSALLNRRRVGASQVVAGLAVMGGLTILLWLFPRETAEPVLPVSTALLLCAAVVALGVLAFALARRVPAGPRALVLATAGGIALGTTAALARVVAYDAAADPTAVLTWLTPLAVAVALFGGLLLQNAYRSGHFAAAYATLIVVDPITGAGIGALLLGEPLPEGLPAQLGATAAAITAIAGAIALAQAKNRNPAAKRQTVHNTESNLVETTSGEPS